MLLAAFAAVIFLLFFQSTALSQTLLTGLIAGDDGQPLPAASVLLLSAADSALVKGQLGAPDGSFAFESVASGNYRILVSLLGFTDYFSESFTLDPSIRKKDLGMISLSENIEQLGEMNIVAKKPLFEQKIDRLVVNVSNSITSAGASALEVLQRSPGVLVNRAANLIGMSGKNDVVILVNGKINRLPASALLQLLDGMNASNIERIELVHTPPADFDAEGNAGIINIVLKKNADDGFNGSYSAYAGYGMKEKAGANLNFNYRRNAANFYGDYSWTYDNNPQQFSNYRGFEENGALYETASVSERDPTRTHTQNARIGLDLQLGPKTVLGALAGWMDRHWKMNAVNTVTMKKNGIPTGFIEIPNDEINRWRHFLGNINLEHQVDKNQRLNIDVDYAYYRFTNPSHYTNRFFSPTGDRLDETQLRVGKTTPMGILAGKADYTRQFGGQLTWEAGLKATMTRFDNDVLVEDLLQEGWARNSDFSAAYSMEENIAAAYSTLALKISDKTDLKAGLRYEHTRSNLGSAELPDIVDCSYDNLFPSLFLAHKFNKNNSVQLSYSRRINRPNFMQLAPYFIFYDPTTVETGNPKLQPSVTNAVKADYLRKSVRLSLQYSHEDEAIASWQPEVDTLHNRQVNGAINFDYAKTAAATLSFPIRPTNWWEMQTSVTVQWQAFQAKAAPSASGQFSWFASGSQNFRLPRQFSIEMTGAYMSGSQYGKLCSRPFGEMSIGIQKELGRHRGTVRFNVGDVFFTANWSGMIDDSRQEFRYEGRYRFSERVFRLTYSNTFGSNKVKAARQRSTGSEEERQRVH